MATNRDAARRAIDSLARIAGWCALAKRDAVAPCTALPLPAAQKGASFAINAKKFREGVGATPTSWR
jgi:hypothetical protein